MIQIRDEDLERIKRIKAIAEDSPTVPTLGDMLTVEQLATEVLEGAALLMQPRKD